MNGFGTRTDDWLTPCQTDYPSACNSTETLIVHESLVTTIWPKVAKALINSKVKLFCDLTTLSSISGLPEVESYARLAQEADYDTEHLDLVLSVIAVASLPAAMQFINTHSSHHTDSIISESEPSISAFCRGIDSAGTFVNASTRFADGFRYGFGTEVGISTGKIHARGPVGLEGLVVYKYMLRSKANGGHIVGDFGTGKKQYKHASINADQVPF